MWFSEGSAALGREARRAVQQSWEDEQVSVSAISFWEAAMPRSRKRIQIEMPVLAWRLQLLRAGLREEALTGDIAALAADLYLPLRDAADRLIVASAISLGATLLTADKTLLKWKGALPRLTRPNSYMSQ